MRRGVVREEEAGGHWGGNILLQVLASPTVTFFLLFTEMTKNCSQCRDPNFTSKEEDDEDYNDGFDFGLDNIDYDNMNFYEMEMYPSPMYDPNEGPDERWVGFNWSIILQNINEL